MIRLLRPMKKQTIICFHLFTVRENYFVSFTFGARRNAFSRECHLEHFPPTAEHDTAKTIDLNVFTDKIEKLGLTFYFLK